jgi:S-adenosylmethionine synthetase
MRVTVFMPAIQDSDAKAAGLASRCEIQIFYAIGVALPVSIRVETFGTGKVEEPILLKLIKKHFDLRRMPLSTV